LEKEHSLEQQGYCGHTVERLEVPMLDCKHEVMGYKNNTERLGEKFA
jgi:hypothetical protein